MLLPLVPHDHSSPHAGSMTLRSSLNSALVPPTINDTIGRKYISSNQRRILRDNKDVILKGLVSMRVNSDSLSNETDERE
jgi:hypothetical protein